jgi:hypothetical protein
MSKVPDDWKKAAVAITPGFEVQGDPYEGVSGDFDDMGISCGALQWNIGQGSLQPMVQNLGKTFVTTIMPTFGNEMWTACNSPIAKGLRIVRGWQPNGRLKQSARNELTALMGSKEMRAEQDAKIDKVAANAFSLANEWAKAEGRQGPSKRMFCWFFDLVTQNGGLEGVKPKNVDDFIKLNRPDKADDVICDFLAGLGGASGHVKDAKKNARLWRDKANGEKLELMTLSYLRSGTANPRWRHVVLNRKGAIALGEGWVNSTKYSFAKHGL